MTRPPKPRHRVRPDDRGKPQKLGPVEVVPADPAQKLYEAARGYVFGSRESAVTLRELKVAIRRYEKKADRG